jgi:hypothetical protein
VRQALTAAGLAVAALLALAVPAAAADASAWHVDAQVYLGTMGPADSSAPLYWTTNGTVSRWELDADVDGLTLSYVQAGGDFGGFQYRAYLVDGRPHRVHLDAVQDGGDLVVRLRVGDMLQYPFRLPGQTLGSITSIVANPDVPIRATTVRGSVDQLTAWSR